MTIRYFRLVVDSTIFRLSAKGDPFIIDSCAALAAANSASSFEIVFSNDLY